MTNYPESYFAALRKILIEAFDQDELEALVSYDDKLHDLVAQFGRHDSEMDMVDETIKWCRKQGHIDHLVERVMKERPYRSEEFRAKLEASRKPEPEASGEPEPEAPSEPEPEAPSEPEPEAASSPSPKPRFDPVRILQSHWPWIVLVLALVVAAIVWLLFLGRSSTLQVAKVVDVAGVIGSVDVPDFTICIEGPSYPTAPDCKTFAPDALVQTWSDLSSGDYTVTEQDPGANWAFTGVPITVAVNPGDDPVQATVTNIFQPGSLQVTKVVDVAVAVEVPDFTICIQGPSYQERPDCKTFSPDALVQTWSGLIPGDYTVSEQEPGGNWAATRVPAMVTVNPGDDPAQAIATVTNIFQPGSLQVTKVVDVAGAVGSVDIPGFTICIEGPSYRETPDCKTFGPDALVQTWSDLIPGDYTVSEQDPGANWAFTDEPITVTVNPGDDPAQAMATLTNTLQPGSLQVTKVVDVAGAVGSVDVPDFTICIEGPSYRETPDCKTFSPDALVQTWSDLIPGDYTVSEQDPGGNWAFTGEPITVTVNPGDDPAQAATTATNTLQPGSLQVTKVVDVAGAVGSVDVPDFAICIEGPSYRETPDCKTFSPDALVQTWSDLIPGDYTVTEQDPGGNWAATRVPATVTVNPGDDPAQAATTVTNSFQLGSLRVTKVVDIAGTVDVPDFTVCIEGRSYRTRPDCKTFSYPGGLVRTWGDLIPGDYTVSEQDPGANWAFTDEPITVTVNPGDDPAQAATTVTNVLLAIAGGDLRWTDLSVYWPCEFEESLPRGKLNGFWCFGETAHLSMWPPRPEGGAGLFDIWWPGGDEGSFRVLRPGTAYEARFIPYEVEDEAAYGIAIKNGQDLIYRFRFWVMSEDGDQVFYIQLLEEASDSPPRLLKEEKGSTLEIARWSDAIHYRLRIERHETELVFRWKAGPASQEWSELHRLTLPQGDEDCQIGLTIEGLANVVIHEIEIMSSAHAAPPIQQEGIVVDNDSDSYPGFRMYPGSSRFYSPHPNEVEKLGAFDDSMRYALTNAEDPSRAEWCTTLEKSVKYKVQVHIPYDHAGHGYAIYEIQHAGGVASVPLNQASFGGEWVVLGVYDFTEGQEVCVGLSALGEQAWDWAWETGYDAVRWIQWEPAE